MVSRRDFCRSLTGAGLASAGFALLGSNGDVARANTPQWSQKPFAFPTPEAAQLIAAAEAQVGRTVDYDGSYVALKYPMGDIPLQTGVCTDVVIRAYRDAFEIDLHKIWGLKRPDKNIDHRRVPNMERFFARQNARLDIGTAGSDFQPGDLVSQRLPRNLPHIGIVSHYASEDGERPMLIHNIGGGTRIEDRLFDFKIVGHYRYLPNQG